MSRNLSDSGAGGSPRQEMIAAKIRDKMQNVGLAGQEAHEFSARCITVMTRKDGDFILGTNGYLQPMKNKE